MAAKPIQSVEKYIYVSEPADALKCPICLAVAEEPWQHGKCGKLFCDYCIEKYGKHKPCPYCKKEQPQYFEDSKSKRDIRALDVKCSNLERRCKWKGTVGELEKHVAKCRFTAVPCPNQCKDNKDRVQHFTRKDLASHLESNCLNREWRCKRCGKKDTYAHITQAHKETCEKKIVSCRSPGCTDTFQRQNTRQHLATCEFAEVTCKYQRLGCYAKMRRKDLSAHENDKKLHFDMALDAIVNMEELVGVLKDTIDKMKNKIDTLEEKIDIMDTRIPHGQ